MNYLPLFPLNLVVYPHEDLNLHIFEPRYRQLINECLETRKTFGIPSFINNKLPGYGTEVRISTLSKRYEDGRLDIKTKGLRIFKILTFDNPVKGKLYAGGEVAFETNEDISEEVNPFLMTLVEQLYDILKVEAGSLKTKSQVNDYQPFSYQIAHKIGLSLQEEYELLTIPTENQRQIQLIEHLERIIPVVSDVERTKDRIAMNGHFKNLDPLNF